MPVSEHVLDVPASKASERGAEIDVSADLQLQQVALLFRQLPAALTATVINAALVFVVSRNVVSSPYPTAWLLAVLGLCGFRLWLWQRFARQGIRAKDAGFVVRLFFAGTVASGMLWGTAGALFVNEAPLNQFFFGLLLAGMAAGGMSTLSSHRGMFAAFVLPELIPFALKMALFGTPLHLAMASMVLLYLGAMLNVSARLHATIAESLRLRVQRVGLVRNLTVAKARLELANKALREEVSERRRTQEVLSKSEQKLRLHTQQALLAFIEWDHAFRVIEWNPAAEKIFGYDRQEAIGRHAHSLIASVRTCETVSVLWQRLLMDGKGAQITAENRTKDGRNIICEWHYTPLVDERGKVLSVITLAQDVTQSRHAQEQLHFLAYHDTLTGLPNRALFNDRLSRAMIEARRQSRHVCVMLLDVDHFKMVNDTMGHDAGDVLLRDVARRLSACVRESDTVARFGGDEFGLVLADMADPGDAMKVAEKIRAAFAPPYFVAGRELYLAPSIGITLYPADGDNLEGLIKNADSAMYHAKAQGRNNFQFYSAELTARVQSRLNLETSLRRALERQEFVLHYQPKIELSSGRITGVEALLRWQSPARGLVSPAEFIAIAEESGLIVPIGEWVLTESCRQARLWHGAGFADLNVAVNLSPRQFRGEMLSALVRRVLAATGMDPMRLELELTETVLLENNPNVRRLLSTLKEIGVSMSIDDFGTGYSSLSYLRRFPIDSLKIDRSFVHDIPEDLDGMAIVRAIIAMARSLRMKVVAEGVETQAQRHFLFAEGCDEIQGFLCAAPMPAEDLQQLLGSQTL